MKQTCILIMGMHRSGTSAITGTLNFLDVYLGRNLMNPGKENPKGFFENKHILELNKKLLNDVYGDWDFPFYSQSNVFSKKHITRLEKLIKKEFIGRQIFAIKDPRLVYLFPIYRKVLCNLDVNIKVIIPYRNPTEVSNSLADRNQFSNEKGLLLWVHYLLMSEKNSRACPRVFTKFDDLILTPLKVIKQIDQKLKLNLNLKYVANKDKIADFLMPSLKNHNTAFNMSPNGHKIISDIFTLLPKLNEVQMDTKFDKLRQNIFENQSLFYNDDLLKDIKKLPLQKKELIAKDAELLAKDAKLLAKDAELLAKESRLEEKDRELVNIRLTTSWKITRPLRKIKEYFVKNHK
jgi:hypothetical protein